MGTRGERQRERPRARRAARQRERLPSEPTARRCRRATLPPALRGRDWLRAAGCAALAVGVIAPAARKRLRLPSLATSLLAWQLPLTTARLLPPGRLRAAATYAAQMWAYYVHYDMPDDRPGALERRVRVDYPIAIDRLFGAGEVPTVRLQRALARGERLRAHDYLLTFAHWAWFVVPHGTVAYTLWRHPERFRRTAVGVAACFDLGLVGYWALPTAPPWWASRIGKLPPVRRTMAAVGERLWGRLWQPLYHSVEGNPYAAMPSLHFGTSVVAARALAEIGPGHGAIGWGYAGVLGFALVYLGEHYVVDLAAGALCAEVAWRLARKVVPDEDRSVSGDLRSNGRVPATAVGKLISSSPPASAAR